MWNIVIQIPVRSGKINYSEVWLSQYSDMKHFVVRIRNWSFLRREKRIIWTCENIFVLKLWSFCTAKFWYYCNIYTIILNYTRECIIQIPNIVVDALLIGYTYIVFVLTTFRQKHMFLITKYMYIISTKNIVLWLHIDCFRSHATDTLL